MHEQLIQRLKRDDCGPHFPVELPCVTRHGKEVVFRKACDPKAWQSWSIRHKWVIDWIEVDRERSFRLGCQRYLTLEAGHLALSGLLDQGVRTTIRSGSHEATSYNMLGLKCEGRIINTRTSGLQEYSPIEDAETLRRLHSDVRVGCT